MFKSIRMSSLVAALIVSAAMLLPTGGRAAAQSAAGYINVVELDIVPAELDKFKDAIKENGAASVKEPGCRQFDILVTASNPNHVFLYEVYNSEAAYQAHRATDHFKKYAATTAAMVAKRESRPMVPVALNAKGH